MASIVLNEMIDRIKLCLNISSDTQLSKRLGHAENYISLSRKRGTIDYDSVFKECYNSDFNWLVTGDLGKPMEMVLIDDQGNRHITDRVSLISSQEQDQAEYLRTILLETQKQLYETQKMLYEYQKKEKGLR